MLTWQVEHVWYEWRCFTAFFHVVLPFADNRSWRLEGGGQTHMAYALEHKSHPSDVRMRRYVETGMQTDAGITGIAPMDNAAWEAEGILAARASVGL